MSLKPWTVEASGLVFEGRYLRVHREHVVTGRGTPITDYHVIESPSWAASVCVTDERQLVLVRQYRHGKQGASLELPAGIIEPNEDPASAAARELLEETGYSAREVKPLWEIYPEPARHRQKAHFFLVRCGSRGGSLSLEASEDVEVVLRPTNELDAIVSEMSHGLHVGALLLAARQGYLGN